jgi:hypothetical protein
MAPLPPRYCLGQERRKNSLPLRERLRSINIVAFERFLAGKAAAHGELFAWGTGTAWRRRPY